MKLQAVLAQWYLKLPTETVGEKRQEGVVPGRGEGRSRTSWRIPRGVMAGQSDRPGRPQREGGGLISPQSQASGRKVPVPALDLPKASSLENAL